MNAEDFEGRGLSRPQLALARSLMQRGCESYLDMASQCMTHAEQLPLGSRRSEDLEAVAAIAAQLAESEDFEAIAAVAAQLAENEPQYAELEAVPISIETVWPTYRTAS